MRTTTRLCFWKTERWMRRSLPERHLSSTWTQRPCVQKIAKDCVDACDKFIKRILDIDPVLEEYLRSEYEKDEEEESLKDKILNELKEIREKIEDESEDSLKEKLLSKVRELKESLDKKKDDQDDEPEQTEQTEQTEEKQEVNV